MLNQKREFKMKVKYSDLKNKRVFITGGGSGIGASIVEHFCEQGSEVHFVDINLKETKKLLINHSQEVGQYLDLSNFNQGDLEYELLKTSGIESIFVGPDFYTLLKNSSSDWSTVLKDINNILDKI